MIMYTLLGNEKKNLKITSYARYSPIPDEAPTIQKTCPLTEPI